MDFSVADVPMMRAYFPEGKTIRDLTDDEHKLLVSRHQAILLNQQLSAAELRHTEFEARLRCCILDLEALQKEMGDSADKLCWVVNRLTREVREAFEEGVRAGRLTTDADDSPTMGSLWADSSIRRQLVDITNGLWRIKGVKVKQPTSDDTATVSMEPKKAEDKS